MDGGIYFHLCRAVNMPTTDSPALAEETNQLEQSEDHSSTLGARHGHNNILPSLATTRQWITFLS